MHVLGNPIDKSEGKPAHLQIKDRLLGLILDGTMSPGAQLIAEPELARILGVSRMTANKSILALVSEGWLVRSQGRGTFVASSLPTEKDRSGLHALTHRIAVTMDMDADDMVNDFYFGALYWGVHHTLSDHGYSVEVVRLNEDLAQSCSNCKGVIAIAPNAERMENVLAYARAGGIVTVLGASWKEFSLNQIDSDNLLGAALAVNHLADLGHSRTLFLGGEPTNANTVARVDGFQLAMKARGLIPRPEEVIVNPSAVALVPEVKEQITDLLLSDDPPTACLAAGAKLAVSLLSLAYSLGADVPMRLSIVAYDDPDFLQLAHPPMTTIRQPLALMAQAACQSIFQQISSGDPRGTSTYFDPELVIRASTAPCPKS